MTEKLVLFTNSFPHHTGETFLETEINYLSTHFRKIDIVPLTHSNSKIIRDVPNNVYAHNVILNNHKNKVELILKGVFNLSPVLPYVTELIHKKIWMKARLFRSWWVAVLIGRTVFSNSIVKKIISESIFDEKTVFYFYWGNNAAWIIPLLPKIFSCKIIVRNHRTDLYEDLHNNYIPLRESIFQGATCISLISNHGLGYLQKKYPQHVHKMKLNLLGVEFKGKSPLNEGNEYTIVSCSGMVPNKRVDFIIHILSYIHTLNITWIHIGSGALYPDIEAKSKTLPKNIQCRLVGHLKNEDILSLYTTQPIDLFINASLSEGLPVSIMEALSCGIPVFATDVGGSAELVNSSNGMIYDSSIAPELLAGNIKHFLQQPTERINQYRMNAYHTWKEKINAQVNYSEFCKMIASSFSLG
jgi:glycosyltransferase involved in cell wall biosynthesis